jgi:hypothetical protein
MWQVETKLHYHSHIMPHTKSIDGPSGAVTITTATTTSTASSLGSSFVNTPTFGQYTQPPLLALDGTTDELQSNSNDAEQRALDESASQLGLSVDWKQEFRQQQQQQQQQEHDQEQQQQQQQQPPEVLDSDTTQVPTMAVAVSDPPEQDFATTPILPILTTVEQHERLVPLANFPRAGILNSVVWMEEHHTHTHTLSLSMQCQQHIECD